MIGKKGDRIVVESEQVGQRAREGEVLAVEERPAGVRYRVRWADGHDSLFIPESGNARIIPAVRPKGRRRPD
jgi:hypothetical protein